MNNPGLGTVMPRHCWTLVSLLAVLTVAGVSAQTAEPTDAASMRSAADYDVPPLPMTEDRGVSPLPPAGPWLDVPPIEHGGGFASQDRNLGQDSSQGQGQGEGSAAAGKSLAAQIHDGSVPLERPDEEPPPSLGDFLGYRCWTSTLDWIPGGGDRFGSFTIAWDHYQRSGLQSGLGVGMGFHFLGGPVQTDMPPRVFDFSLAYQIRNQWGPLRYDLAASVLAASDFEGSARKGILFPAHAVGYFNFQPEFDLVFGVDFLDRGDLRLLPVGGLVWTPTSEFRIEAVFPRPRAVVQWTERHRLYVAGELGGGTWAIERADLRNDLATYHDLGVYLGLEHVEQDGGRWAFEVGYLFDRRMQYASHIGDTPLSDAMMLRLVTRY